MQIDSHEKGPQESKNAGHKHKYFDFISEGITNLITDPMSERMNYWTVPCGLFKVCVGN
jgi:hypothetical protein